MLNKQVQIYSVNTNSFFNEEEELLSKEIACCKRKIIIIEQFSLLNHKEIIIKDKDRVYLNIKFDSINDFCEKKNEDEDYNLFVNKLYNKNKKLVDSFQFKVFINELYRESKERLDIKYNKYVSLLKEFDEEFKLIFDEEFKLIDKNKRILKFNPKNLSKLKKNKKLSKYKIKENEEVRELNPKKLSKYKIVSIFDSNTTRVLNLETNKLSTDLIIVEVYHYPILNDLLKNGCTYMGERYIYFTSSSGQIRDGKIVLIKEKVWEEKKNILMCGLTIEDINNREFSIDGEKYYGCNINKFLSYLALNNTATDVWKSFDIDKAIVIDDFETLVRGEVDYIDNKTFIAERKKMYIPIVHSDGCGWILPSESKRNFMIRLPWMKGLLTSADYLSYCENYNEGNYRVTDIYGKEWDLLKDDIRYVFSKSQFKMYKYYPNIVDENRNIVLKYGWDVYKDNFKKYDCHASRCNVEESNASKFKNKTVPYQMWQTLIDITDEEADYFTKPTIEYLTKAYTEREFMLDILGVNNEKKNYLQQALSIYPELIRDAHVHKKLADIINSKKKDAKYAKFEINCKYTYILPDVFAWMQYSISGIKNPVGLLKNGEVSCKLYEDGKEIAVNRNPHLYKEWGIRKNIVNYANENWFTTNGVYASCHDLISKLIMCDWDGDTSLVIGDSVLVQRAKLCMEGIVPLYYEMGVANPQKINAEKLYDSLVTAFKYGNIGEYSNKLTRIYNSEDINMEAVKAIVAENNFSIDAAKTLIFPKPQGEMEKIIADSAKREKEIEVINKKGKKIKKIKKIKIKLPYFFQFVKKDCKDVEPINDSTVNQICAKIEGMKQNDYNYIQIPSFRYDTLLRNKKIKINQIVADEYLSLNKEMQSYFRANKSEENKKEISKCIWGLLSYEFINFCEAEDIKYEDAVDMIIRYIYQTDRNCGKELLFNVFGDVIVKNLKNNIGNSMICKECHKRTKRKSNAQTMCTECAEKAKKENVKKSKEKAKGNK